MKISHDPRDRLITSSRHRMAKAITAWSANDAEEVATSSALAVEYLAKAALYAINPVLLIEMNAKQDEHLVRLCLDPSAALMNKQLKTVSLRDALKRLEWASTFSPSVKPKEVEALADIRNGVIHIGALFVDKDNDGSSTLRPQGAPDGPSLRPQDVLGYALLLVADILPLLDLTSPQFYGPQVETASALLIARSEQVKLEVLALQEAARRRWQDRGELDSPHRASIAWGLNAARIETAAMWGYRAVVQQCPVCRNTAVLAGELSADDLGADDYHNNRRGGGKSDMDCLLYPAYFDCPSCGLEIKGLEHLRAAALPCKVMVVNAAEFFPGLQDLPLRQDELS